MHGANLKYFSKKYNIEEKNILDFSSNINIFTPDINYFDIEEYINKNINKYPDINYIDLKENISKIYSIDYDNIYAGNGATEVLYDILLLDIFKNIGIFNPSFSEYERASNIYKKNIIDLDINNLYLIDENTSIKYFMDNIVINKCVDYWKNIPDIIVICNPNNPTGKIYNLEDLVYFCEKNNIFLLIDETFIDFCSNENYSLRYKDSKNIIVLSAITKFFAMTGARLGYCFCKSKKIINMLENIKKPWSINILAEYILDKLTCIESSFYDITKKYYDDETKRLYLKYKNIAFTEKSSSCFFYLTLKNKSVFNLQEILLKKHNILIRVLDNYKNIKNSSVRIAIKNKDDNDMLFDVIKNYIGCENG